MVGALPDSCREALLLLATCRSDRAVVIRRALAGSGLTDDAFAAAEHEGLVRLEREARISPPPDPVRGLRVGDRTRAGAAPTTRWPRRAWSPSWSGSGSRTGRPRQPSPTRSSPASVERLASDVRLRGGAIATVEWYQRAAALSDEPAARLRRLLAAADAAQAERPGQAAGAILAEIETRRPAPRRRRPGRARARAHRGPEQLDPRRELAAPASRPPPRGGR